MNYKQRKSKFSRFSQIIGAKKISDLVATGKMNNDSLEKIQLASKLLLMSSLKEHKPNLKSQTNFNKIIRDVLKHRPSNVTHNGLIVPKKENSLEYNLFLKFILDFLKESKILGIVDRFISPPQLRIKFGKTKKRKNFNASEHPHSDAWTKYNTDKSYTLYFPIFGDYKNNYVRFFKPKKNFENNWLSPKKFVDGKIISKDYIPLPNMYFMGKYVITDCATLHESVLDQGAKPRISIDTAFIPKGNILKKKYDSHIKKEKLSNIGRKSFFVFKNSFKESLKNIKKRNKQSLQDRYIYQL